MEIPNNGIDEDCDGEDLIISTTSLDVLRPKIFPNPTTGELQIDLNGMATAEIRLKNLSGKVLYFRIISQDHKLNLEDLAAGIYILEI